MEHLTDWSIENAIKTKELEGQLAELRLKQKDLMSQKTLVDLNSINAEKITVVNQIALDRIEKRELELKLIENEKRQDLNTAKMKTFELSLIELFKNAESLDVNPVKTALKDLLTENGVQ